MNDNTNFIEEEEYNYFTDSTSGRMLISYLNDYFNQFDEIDSPSNEQMEEAFRQVIGDLVKLLEEATGEKD